MSVPHKIVLRYGGAVMKTRLYQTTKAFEHWWDYRAERIYKRITLEGFRFEDGEWRSCRKLPKE